MIVLAEGHRVARALRRALPALLADEFPEVRGRVKLLPNGPPVPYPVQFRVVGPEAAQVRAWADEVKEIMRANPELRGVNDNWNESVKVAAPRRRPGQGARARRDEPGHGAGLAHDPTAAARSASTAKATS